MSKATVSPLSSGCGQAILGRQVLTTWKGVGLAAKQSQCNKINAASFLDNSIYYEVAYLSPTAAARKSVSKVLIATKDGNGIVCWAIREARVP